MTSALAPAWTTGKLHAEGSSVFIEAHDCIATFWSETDEAHADATLFAAASSLYEQLKDIRDRFHKALVHAGSDPEFADAACAQADAALAAARGDR